MAARIATLQRQARELGRLRTGYTQGRTPKRSETWIVTSHAQHYVEAAAAEWGGKAEKWQPLGNGAPQWRVVTEASALDAILPPGDPLNQAFELWNKGGCARRCDGTSEDLSAGPCICRAEHGEDFWQTAPKDTACKATTRLNVMLPAMPDLGVWRYETHSYYAANEIAGMVDTLRGMVGQAALVPVRLRIEQRTRVAGGKTKHFPVVAVELRGPTAGQLLAGTANLTQIGAGQPPAALPSGVGVPDYAAQAYDTADADAVRAIYRQATQAGHMTDELKAKLTEIGKTFASADQQQPAGQPAGEDPDAVWQEVVAACPDTWTLDDLEARFAEQSGGLIPKDAGAGEMRRFLDWLHSEAVKS